MIVTACFDSALEQAFKEAGEPVDLVGFVGDDDVSSPGHFQHLTPDGVCHDIKEPNTYPGLDLSKRPVILKLYRGYNSKSFLITEDHYIDYLSHMGMTQLVPTSLLQILDDSMLLFLGYNLAVWNQRVILRRLWQKKLLSEKSWLAIQATPDALDSRMWKRYSVKVLQRPDFQLEDYIAAIQNRLQAMPDLSSVIASSSGESSKRNKVFFS
ncbi:MAG: SIR2 family protein, partial [bacterium]